MTYSDEEIDAACAKFFAVELAQDHESVKDSARNSMRAALSTLTTPKAWTPIGWNGPFRAREHGHDNVLDANDNFVCRALTPQAAAEIASALNTALARAALKEPKT